MVAFYVGSCLLRAWNNPSGPHVHRQIDTAGITVSMAEEVKKQGGRGVIQSMLFPRLLQRGLTSGINVTEFPLLSALTFPFFLEGPRVGVFLSSLLIVMCTLICAVLSLPMLWEAWGIQLPKWAALAVFFSLPSISFHSSIYMPEGLSFPLLVTGAALLCSLTWKSSFWAYLGAYLCLSLAVAVKPLAVLGFLPVALWPIVGAEKTLRSRTRFLVFFYGILFLSLVFPLWWFKIHAQEIVWVADGVRDSSSEHLSPYSGTIMALSRLAPLSRLSEVGLHRVLTLLLQELNHDQFPYYLGILWTAVALAFEPLLFIGMITMLLGAISLLGPPIWVHEYYFFASSLMSLLLMGRALTAMRSRFLLALCCASIAWGVLYNIRCNIWISARTLDRWRISEPLAKAVPASAHIITDDGDFCPTKLLTTGRPGTLAADRLNGLCREPGYRDLELAYLVDEHSYLRGIQDPRSCLREAAFISKAKGEIPERSESWVLLLSKPNGERAENGNY